MQARAGGGDGDDLFNDDDLYEAYGLSPRDHPGEDPARGDGRTEEDGLDGNIAPEGMGPRSPSHVGKVSWLLMASIMTAEVVGNGVLALPKAYTKLGWVPANLTLVTLYIVTTHTGMLMHRMKTALPNVRSYPNLFFDVFGRGGYVYASLLVYFLLFMYVAAGILVQAASWKAIFYQLTSIEWMLVSMAMSWVVLQFRTMKNIAILCVLGIITIIIPIILSFVTFADMVHETDGSGALLHPPGPKVALADNFQEGVVAAMDMVYSFSGHVVFFELLSQIKDPAHFPRALILSQTTILAIYLTVGNTGYALVGDASWLQAPFTVSLRNGPVRIIVQLLIVVHITVGVSVNGTVLVRAVQNSFEPVLKAMGSPPNEQGHGHHRVAPREENTSSALLWWGAWSALVLLFCGMIIIIIPSFEHFIGITASIAASQTTLSWPGFIDIYMFGRTRTGWTGKLRNVASGTDFTIGIFCLVVGAVGNLWDLGRQDRA